MKCLFTFLSRRAAVFIALFLLTGVIANAQLKIGTNPTTIQKSAILELEATRQGLLLPRLLDTVAINLLLPPDGMMIFLVPDASLRVRSNGYWKKVADAGATSSNWTITGNSGTDSTLNYIGTLDGKPLTMKTNGLNRMIVSSDGNIGIGTTTPSATLNVNGSVKFQGLAPATTELDVLVLAANGSVYKKTLAANAFVNAIRAINGIQKETLSVNISTNTSVDTAAIVNSVVDSTIAIYLPVQNGSNGSTKPYGFLTYHDWQRIDSAVQIIAIGAVGAGSNVNGASIAITNDSTRTITLYAADATNPGIVTAGAQTFGGDKTFNGNATVVGNETVNGNGIFNGTLTLNNVATNAVLDSVLVISNGLVQKRQVNGAAFSGAIRSINGNRDSIQVFAFKKTGADLSISTSLAPDSIFFNVPDAGIAARGVVTTTLQTFGGVKKFQDSVAAAVAMLVGGAGNANSTVQVNGSMSMVITTVVANATLSVNDNTVLVNTTGGPITITLPAAGGIAGRIYTIKKIGTGDIDMALTITPTAGTIDGGANYIIYNDYSFVTVQTDGTNWYIVKK